MKKKQWIMILLLIIIIIILIMIAISVWKKTSSGLASTRVETPKKVEGFIGIEVKVPGREPDCFWELNVAKMTNVEGEDGLLTKVEGKYIINQIPQYFVKSDLGTILWKDNVIKLEGNVVLTSSDGKKIVADLLHWDSNNNKVTAENEVSFLEGSSSIKTEKISADLDFNKVVFTGMTNVVIRGAK